MLIRWWTGIKNGELLRRMRAAQPDAILLLPDHVAIRPPHREPGAGQRRRTRHLLYRRGQFHPAGEENEGRQRHLDGPERLGHYLPTVFRMLP